MPRAASVFASEEESARLALPAANAAPGSASTSTSEPPPQRPCRLTPAQRIRKKREFDGVYRQARRSTDGFFTVLAKPNTLDTPRLGLSIPARAVGNAVRRNLVKRLIRESFRKQQYELPHADIVVNARSAVRDADNNAILRSLERHWLAIRQACARS